MNKKLFKRLVSLFLLAIMLTTTFGQYHVGNALAASESENSQQQSTKNITKHAVYLEGKNAFLGNENAINATVGQKYYLEYKVADAQSYSKLQGLVMTKDKTAAYPYDKIGYLYHCKGGDVTDATNLLVSGATYKVCFTVTNDGFTYEVLRTKSGGTEEKLKFETKVSSSTSPSDLKYFGLWFGTSVSDAVLSDVCFYDTAGNDLGVYLKNTFGRVYESNIPYQKNATITDSYTIDVTGKNNLMIGNIASATADTFYIEYKVTSVDQKAVPQYEGVAMTTKVSGDWPYAGDGMLRHNKTSDTNGKSILLEEGAEYIICVERKSDTCKEYVQKTKDGVTTLYRFNRTDEQKGFNVTNKYYGLWFYGANTSFQLVNVKMYDANGKNLRVQSNQKIGIKAQDVDYSNVSKRNVYISNKDVFLGNETDVDIKVGDEYYLTYTVSNTSAVSSLQGIIATQDKTLQYPYAGGVGYLHYQQNDLKTANLLEEGATYSIRCTLSDSGFLYDIVKTKDGKSVNIFLPKSTGTNNGVMHSYGLWLGASKSDVNLRDVMFYDADGNDLGVWVKNEFGFAYENTLYKSNDEVKTSYDVTVDKKDTVMIGNIAFATTPKFYIEYMVDAIDETAIPNYEGIAMTTKIQNKSYPYAGDGQLKFFKNSGKSVLLEKGAKYIACIERNETGFTVYVQKTKDGVTTIHQFDKIENYGFTEANQYFGLWFFGATASYKLTGVKLYDENNNNLGVQSNRVVAIEQHSETVTEQIKEHTLKIAGKEIFVGSDKAIDVSVGSEFFFTYKVDSVNKASRQQGFIVTDDHTLRYPYDQGRGKMYFNQYASDELDVNNLLEVGATYQIRCAVTPEGLIYNIEKTKDNKTQSVVFNKAVGANKTGAIYFGLWFAINETDATLTNVKCYDAGGNDLGIFVRGGIELVTDEPVYKNNDKVKVSYDVTVNKKDKVMIGNIAFATTPKFYIEYTVDSFDETAIPMLEGIAMTTKVQKKSYPYANDGELKWSKNNEKSTLLEKGAKYIICIERNETGFTEYVQKTKDGVTTLYRFDRIESYGFTDANQYFGLWFFGAEASYKLKNVKIYDDNNNNLGVQSNSVISVKRNSETDTNKVKNHTLNISGKDVFISSEKPVNVSVGSEYFLSYTVASVKKAPRQQGLIVTEDNTLRYPYDKDKGLLYYNQYSTDELDVNNMLEAGATYHIRCAVTAEGLTYNIDKVKDGKTESVVLFKAVGTNKTGAVYYGLWLAITETEATLKNVKCYDEKGNNLGIAIRSGVEMITNEARFKKNTKVKASYDVEVFESRFVMLNNVQYPKTDTFYMEYKVESAEYELNVAGVLMSETDGKKSSYPYVNGDLHHNYYSKPVNEGVSLLEPGAEYIIKIEKTEEGFREYVQKTKNGVVSLYCLKSVSADSVWTGMAKYFGLWFHSNSANNKISFKLTNFKIYDETNTNLGVDCNQKWSVVRHGELDNYADCEAVYYCRTNGDYITLNEKQRFVITRKGVETEGQYQVVDNQLTVKSADETNTYEYYYGKITDTDGNVYERLYTYKVNFVTGTDETIDTQLLSNETGYFATAPNAPTGKGREFEGWYLADGTEYDFDKIVTESVTLYAKYSGDGGFVYETLGEAGNTKIILIVSAVCLVAAIGCVSAYVCFGKSRGAKNGSRKKD